MSESATHRAARSTKLEFGLLTKFLLILSPVILILAIPGIALLVHQQLRTDQESLVARVGNYSARAASALSRHDWRSNPSLARDLLAPLAADRAFLCAELIAGADRGVLIAQPPSVGCKGRQDEGHVLRLPVAGVDDATLILRFSDEELRQSERIQGTIASSVVAISFILSILAATIGFRFIVSRPMKLLLASIRHYAATGTRNPIRLHRRDEIGAVITAFNEMLERETEREAALNHSKRQLESSKSDLARLNQNLEQQVRDRTVDLAAKNSALQREIETREFAERDRDTAETRLFEAIDSMSEGFAVWASDDRLVMCNSRYLAAFEKLSDILVPGVHFADFLESAVERGVYDPGDLSVDDFIRERLEEHRNPVEAYERRVGDERWMRISKRRTDSGGIVGTWTDITEGKKAEETIRDLAMSDTLTGLANRNRFHADFEHALADAKRQNDRVALLILDLDNLKDVNDEFGHPVGDALLEQVASRLIDCARETDTVARLGGDEFAIIMTHMDRADAPAHLADRIIDSLSATLDLAGQSLAIGTSIGISVYPDDDTNVEELMRKADSALYQAKVERRGSYQLYDAVIHNAVLATNRLERDLRLAIERDEFTLHYQPQIDVSTKQVTGVEALIRWQHPERGLLSPGEFIAVAESSDLIVKMGRQALRMACRQGRQWQGDARMPPLVVAVNISPRQFKYDDLVALVEDTLRETGLDAGSLELEITEGTMMEDTDQASDTLSRLKELGVKIAIDDFGTGYSSLAYLKRFPVQRLKIDQSFVRGLTNDKDDVAIVKAMIGLGRSLRLDVIAEGVETEAELGILADLGCQEAQGYLICRPVPPEELEAWVQARDPARALAPNMVSA